MQQTRSPYQIAMSQMDCDLFHVSKNENSKIRSMTFFPPFIILVAFLVLSLVD